MSVREEIARALHRADIEPRRFDRHWIVREWDELSNEARDYWYRLAEALMPIVERVAREAAMQGINEGARSRAIDAQTIGAIVRRVVGDALDRG